MSTGHAHALEPLSTLLYVSEATVHEAAEIDRICRRSRDNNRRDGITGLLVFDGHAFCQFVEGADDAVAGLLRRLERDPRHSRMEVLHHGPAQQERRFRSWRLGYAYSADPAAIARVEAARGENALREFDLMQPHLTPR